MLVFYFVIYVGRVFSQKKGHLARQISSYISKEPYVGILFCDLCWKSFPQKSHLSRYICSHISKETYGGIIFCDLCRKGFSQKKGHLARHISKKPYVGILFCD
jgi:hypothetical protein